MSSQAERKVIVIGCGDIGSRLAADLHRQKVRVYGLRRHIEHLPATLSAIAADVTDIESLNCLRNQTFDTAIITLTPGQYTEAQYQLIYVQGVANVLAVLQARHIIFVSSTSVYHQADGQWVNEASATQPLAFAGRRLLEAEALVQSAPAMTTVVRFSGIYGAGSNRLIAQVLAGQQSVPTFSNRIHQADCVGFLQHLLFLQWRGAVLQPCYLATDNEPALLSEVKLWIAKQLGVELSALSSGGVRQRQSRRCSNKLMLATGYRLQYPNFRSGYTAIINTEPGHNR